MHAARNNSARSDAPEATWRWPFVRLCDCRTPWSQPRVRHLWVSSWPGGCLLAARRAGCNHSIQQWRDRDVLVLDPKPFRLQLLRQLDEGRVGQHVEKVRAPHAWVVLVLHQIAGGQVHRRQVCGELGYVRAVHVGEQVPVVAVLGQHLLAGVGAHQKSSTATSWVQHLGVAGANAETVYQVHHFNARVVLTVFVALFRSDQSLKDAAHHLVVELGEVELVNLVDQAAPALYGGVGIERNATSHVFGVVTKDGLVIPRDLFGFSKEML
jgi:hypothetical protein